MRFACIERDDHALVLKIDSHIVHAFNLHERSAQLSHSALREKRIGWIRIAWSGGVHRFLILLI